MNLQDTFVVPGGFDKPHLWGSATIDCAKRIVSHMYHVLGDRATPLMNFISDGRYSPQVEGTPTLLCWLLIPDPREVGSFPLSQNTATELNGRLIVAKGGDETPECIAAAFSKRRKTFAVVAPPPRRPTTSSVPVELSMSQIYPSTPHGEDERYSVFDEEDDGVGAFAGIGSLTDLAALVAAGNPVVKPSGSDSGFSLSQLQSLVNDESPVTAGIFPMGGISFGQLWWSVFELYSSLRSARELWLFRSCSEEIQGNAIFLLWEPQRSLQRHHSLYLEYFLRVGPGEVPSLVNMFSIRAALESLEDFFELFYNQVSVVSNIEYIYTFLKIMDAVV